MFTQVVKEAVTRVETRISAVSPCVVATAGAWTCCFDALMRPASASIRLRHESYRA